MNAFDFWGLWWKFVGWRTDYWTRWRIFGHSLQKNRRLWAICENDNPCSDEKEYKEVYLITETCGVFPLNCDSVGWSGTLNPPAT